MFQFKSLFQKVIFAFSYSNDSSAILISTVTRNVCPDIIISSSSSIISSSSIRCVFRSDAH